MPHDQAYRQAEKKIEEAQPENRDASRTVAK